MFSKSHPFLVLLFLALFVSQPARATGMIAGATEPTQIMNNIQLLMSYVEQAQQTVTQIHQYETMLKNLQKMGPSSLLDSSAQQLWTDMGMTKTFADLRTTYINGQRVAYSLSSLDQNFQRLHPGYGNFGNGFSYTQAYKNLSDNTLGAVKSAMAMVGAQGERFANEQAVIQDIQRRSETADGQAQALKVGREIAVAEVNQLQQLRQLQMAQMHAQNAFMAGEQSRKDTDDAALRQLGGGRTRVQTIKEMMSGGVK